jgi:hypothetical protein
LKKINKAEKGVRRGKEKYSSKKRDERGDTTTDLTEIKSTMTECYDKLCRQTESFM